MSADHVVTDGPGEIVVVKGPDGRIFGPYMNIQEAEALWRDCYPEGGWEWQRVYTLTPAWEFDNPDAPIRMEKWSRKVKQIAKSVTA